MYVYYSNSVHESLLFSYEKKIDCYYVIIEMKTKFWMLEMAIKSGVTSIWYIYSPDQQE